jgi:hypothetical protein
MTQEPDSHPPEKLDRLIRVWCALAGVALLTGGYAYWHRPATSPVRAPHAKPAVLVGVRGADGRVCTERAVLPGNERWSCVSWVGNPGHVAVVEPKPYPGVCTHLVADQTGGRWTCPGFIQPTLRPELVV